MAETVQGTERVVRVADINPRHRHVIIFQLFEHLAPGNSLQLVVDHDPKPLRFQLEARARHALRLVLPRGRSRCLAGPPSPSDGSGWQPCLTEQPCSRLLSRGGSATQWTPPSSSPNVHRLSQRLRIEVKFAAAPGNSAFPLSVIPNTGAARNGWVPDEERLSC